MRELPLVDPRLADSDDITNSGHVFLFKWLYERWSEDAARHIIFQFLSFYAFLIVGFGFLYVMMRSTSTLRSQMRELRKDVALMISEQKQRKYSLDDYARQPLSF